MALDYRLADSRGLEVCTRERVFAPEALPRARSCSFQRLTVKYAFGPPILLNSDGVEEKKLRYTRLQLLWCARFWKASSYFSINRCINSTASEAGLTCAGSTRNPSPWPLDDTRTTSSTPSCISRSISGGIGSMTEPPTFFRVLSTCMMPPVGCLPVKQYITFTCI